MQDLTGLLIQILTIGLTTLIPLVPFFIPRTVKMITLISLSESKATRFFGTIGYALTIGLLALPLMFFLAYIYAPNGSVNASSLFLAMIHSLFPVMFVSLASTSFVYEKAIGCLEEDSVRIKEKIDALGVKATPKRVRKGEESSIQRGIEAEIRYLKSRLLEKRKTIAKVRREVNKIYPSEKSSMLSGLALVLFMPVSLLIMTFLLGFIIGNTGPPFTALVNAIIIGILIGSFLIFVVLKGENMAERMRRCGAVVGTTDQERSESPR